MQGDGTQTNPYIPENWEEFVEAVGTEDAYVSVPEKTTYDCNKIAPTGLPMIEFNCTELNGNNLVILKPFNLRFWIKSNSSKSHTIKNIHVNDFYQSTSGWAMFSLADDEYSKIDIYDSTFSGVVDQGGSHATTWYLIGEEYGGAYINQSMTRCSGNIMLTGKMSGIGLGYRNYFCNFNVELGSTSNINSGWYGGISNYIYDSFIRFTGDPLLENYPTTEYARRGGISRSIIVWTNNKAMIGGISETRQINCTWDELRNVEFLREKGFPILS